MGILTVVVMIIFLIVVLLDIAVVDMSDVFRQPSLFYHLGVRESFDMANNVILYHDTDPDTAQSLKVHTPLLISCHCNQSSRMPFLCVSLEQSDPLSYLQASVHVALCCRGGGITFSNVKV